MYRQYSSYDDAHFRGFEYIETLLGVEDICDPPAQNQSLGSDFSKLLSLKV
jgi:hypothetical protein